MSRKYIFDVSTLMKVFVALDINNLFKFHCINCGTVAPMAWQDVACNQAGSQFSMDASSSCTVRKKSKESPAVHFCWVAHQSCYLCILIS
jgi:hypothetical protein